MPVPEITSLGKLQLADFVSYRSLSEVELSPDGKKVAFIVHQANMEENDYASNIFLCRLDTGDVSQLTVSRKVIAFEWLGDSQHILFFEWEKPRPKATPCTQAYRIGIDGVAVRKVFTVPGRAMSIKLLDDQRLLYLTQVDVTTGMISGRDEQGCRVADELPFWRDRQGFTNKKRVHLYLFDTETQQSDELTGGLLDVEAFDIRGERIVLSGNDFDQVAPLCNDLYLLDLTDLRLQRLTDRTHMFHGPRFLTDDLVGALGSDIARFGFRQNKEVMALHLGKGRLESLTPAWDKSVRQQSVSTDVRLGDNPISCAAGGRYICITTERNSAYLNAIDVNGKVTRLVDEPGAVDGFDVKGDTVVYTAMRDTHLPELFTVQNGVEKRLTGLNLDALAGKTVSTPEHFTVRTTDGVEIDGWLIRPVGCQPGKRYPAVLEVHGGPKAMAAPVFFHEHQVLANAGYAVFTCNPRGSDGRGDAFHGAVLGNFGTIDYDDIMAVVDHVVQRYDLVDPERLGVTGPSYGGYMTNWIIGHTHRFKAAVSTNGISNLLSMIGTTEIGYYWLEQYLTVTPWEDMEKYWFHSPLRYADQVDTPTLFLQSDQDYVCGIPQGLEIFTALKYFGVDTRMCIFQGESHAFMRNGKPKNRIRYLKEMVAWFDAYLEI